MMSRLAFFVAASLLCASCGDGDASENSGDFDAGMSADAGDQSTDSMAPFRTTESAVLYWPLRPDLTGNVAEDLGPGGFDLELGAALSWYDDADNGVFLGPGAELDAELENAFPDREFSVDFWWKPVPDREVVQVLQLEGPDAPLITVQLESMQRWSVNVILDDETTESVDFGLARSAVQTPIHLTLTLDRHGTLRIYSFGVQEHGIALPETFTLPETLTVTFGDDSDDAADGTLHTAAIYDRPLTEAEIWDHYRVGPFPAETDEIDQSTDKWILLASRDYESQTGPTLDFAYIDSDEPERHYEDVERYDADRGETGLVRWWLDRLPTPGPVERTDLRAWASLLRPEFSASLEISAANRDWDPDAATWVSAGPEPWETPGALARPEDRSEERFEAVVSGIGAFHLPISDALIARWKADPSSNYGIVLRPETDNDIELCARGCGRSSLFIGAVFGRTESPRDEPAPAPDVSFEALGDGGIRVVAETDFCGDPDDGLAPCVIDLYSRGRFLGRSYLGGVDDRNWRPDQGETFRVYVLDEDLRPSLPFDGAPQ